MGKTNLPRLVTYAENPQLVSRLEEFCQQNRCSISKGINQLLEQALGLTPLASTINSTAVLASTSTAQLVDDTAHTSVKTELNELERKFDDLRSAVNELRVSPPAMPLASTVHTATSTALSWEAIQSNLIKEFNNSENPILTQLREEFQEIAHGIQELLSWKKEIENQELHSEENSIDDTIKNFKNQVNELNQKLEQETAKAEQYFSFYQLWYRVFPGSVTYQDICRHQDSDYAWVRTSLSMDETFKVFIPS